MRYRVRQRTRYAYTTPVPFARHVLHLLPVDAPGQTILTSTLTIDPQPNEVHHTIDFFGNRVTHLSLETPHQAFHLNCVSLVRMEQQHQPAPLTSPSWETVRDAAAASYDLGALSPVHHLFPSPFVPLVPHIRDYARQSFTPGKPILEACTELMNRIYENFTYDAEATDVATPVAEAFALRSGVCQDFAHIMISGLRALGLPAAYISGYLRTIPPPGMPRLEGADATHAWVSVWCGDEIGWQGFDPTNGMRTATDHIISAFGRDYGDVSPVDGVIIASGDHDLTVEVDVIPLD